MIDQFVVFAPSGQVFYSYSPQGKRLAEIQVNKVVSELIANGARRDEGSHKYTILKLDQFGGMCNIVKHPPLVFLCTYAAQELEQLREAEQILDLGTNLWDSLGLLKAMERNISRQGVPKNQHNYTWVLQDCDEQLSRFDEYFKLKLASVKTGKTKAKEPPIKATQQSLKPSKKPVSNAKSRKWGRDGIMEDNAAQGDLSSLDFSTEGTPETTPSAVSEVNEKSFGTRTENGEFLIKEIDELLNKNKSDSAKKATTTTGAFGFLQKHLLGNKSISQNDLTTVLDKLKQKLITKNVAPEAADHLASRVSQNLIGTTTANWTSVETTAKETLQQALTELLTPGVSVDLLREIQQRIGGSGQKRPYVFSIVGVNGVGKSTNLSKLAFWLLQNNFRVLIVACDTFRSGAVEQLRVHVENLAQLTDETHTRGVKNRRGKTGNDFVELFEAGYGGSDLVTKIAKQAIKYASDQSFDIVLMDTAGRRHNDPTLMSPLKPFADQAKPDKIIMVGEALVGTDSVQQAQNFNAAFGKERNLDFFIISKCDTVGDMLGAMVNMVYATGIPILFVGVGQTYTDLRTLSVGWAVDTLMS
ncbi:LAFA_0E12618g1_1 [Lachancea sp. 'fantastica']|nr:LAFA_0E12618g1_1 [Lachancea sp. 'fantastica']